MDIEKEKRAIEVLKAFEPEDEPYYLCYSGGKDSDCIRILAQLAGVKHELHHNLTTVDAPETVQYIKLIPGVIIDKARWNYDSKTVPAGTHKTMFNLIPHKLLPPTRLGRYCCEELKEAGGRGRLKMTGVRKDESSSRKANGGLIKILGREKTNMKFFEKNGIEYEQPPKGGIILNYDNAKARRGVEQCYRTSNTMINPIIDWTENDVWDFLNYYNCKSNPLYECGKTRVGCIGCPLAQKRNQQKEFIMYPKYRNNYIRAFNKMLDAMDAIGKRPQDWENGVDVLKWWADEEWVLKGQTSFYTPEYLKDIPDELYHRGG